MADGSQILRYPLSSYHNPVELMRESFRWDYKESRARIQGRKLERLINFYVDALDRTT